MNERDSDGIYEMIGKGGSEEPSTFGSIGGAGPIGPSGGGRPVQSSVLIVRDMHTALATIDQSRREVIIDPQDGSRRQKLMLIDL